MKGFIIPIMLLSMVSCKKPPSNIDRSTQSAKDAWTGMNQFHTIMREIHRVAQVDSILNQVPSMNAIAPSICSKSITRAPDIGPFPIDLTLTYDTAVKCTGQRSRSGEIIANFSGVYSNLGTIIQISLVDYMSENYLVSGDITMNVGKRSSDTLGFNVSILNGKIIDTRKTSLNTSYISGNIYFENNTGRATVSTTDDDFSISGAGEGIASNGVTYTYTIDNTFQLQATCTYAQVGSFTLLSPNASNRVCDVSPNTQCDGIMSVSIVSYGISEKVDID